MKRMVLMITTHYRTINHSFVLTYIAIVIMMSKLIVHTKKADLCIVAGTSMSLRHITHFPFQAKRTVIINLQETPDDDRCDLRIFAKCDPIFEAACTKLGVVIDPIPV
jgi:NAD-dependent SIR2 family protein deacetylase